GAAGGGRRARVAGFRDDYARADRPRADRARAPVARRNRLARCLSRAGARGACAAGRCRDRRLARRGDRAASRARQSGIKFVQFFGGAGPMINLKDIRYLRVGTPDLDSAVKFCTEIVGLQLVAREGKAAYFRSDKVEVRGDTRDHTLVYFEGDPS